MAGSRTKEPGVGFYGMSLGEKYRWQRTYKGMKGSK